jgi:hypothetical protein
MLQNHPQGDDQVSLPVTENTMHKALIPASLLLLAAAAGPASAIECDGNFQVQRDGTHIATPYCEDGYLAIVAREYGMHISAQAIRYNPSVKERACRLVGDDIRVKSTCDPYRNDDHFRIPY